MGLLVTVKSLLTTSFALLLLRQDHGHTVHPLELSSPLHHHANIPSHPYSMAHLVPHTIQMQRHIHPHHHSQLDHHQPHDAHGQLSHHMHEHEQKAPTLAPHDGFTEDPNDLTSKRAKLSEIPVSLSSSQGIIVPMSAHNSMATLSNTLINDDKRENILPSNGECPGVRLLD